MELPQSGFLENLVDKGDMTKLAPWYGDRDTDSRNFSPLHVGRTLPSPPDTHKGPAAVMQAIDERLEYKDWLQLATSTGQP